MFDKMIKKSIKELILEISQNPLLHFSEKSLQVRLAAKLIKYPELSTPIQTRLYERYEKQMRRLESNESYLRNALSIAPLQMEYGTNDRAPYRIDIAILDPEEIRLIDSWQFQRERKYLVPVIGIEIGTEKIGMGKISDKHLKNDAEKLKDSKLGYILNILRNTNVCGKQTKSYENKVQQLDSFRNGLRRESMLSKHPHINWIGLIIHIAYQEVEFFGINNDWKTFTVPSKNFQSAVNEKLWSAALRNGSG